MKSAAVHSQVELEFDEVAPDASAMIESMRAYGYSMPAAIADLVDNSIAAEAQHIWIDFHWAGEDSWVRVVDDGHGMTERELVNAMRLGSASPLKERDPGDLGRFGLGLKTASFSQGRCLTVATRASGEVLHMRRWDLDHLAREDVSGWQLLKTIAPESRAHLRLRNENGAGTVVLVERLDRLAEGAEASHEELHNHFLQVVSDVEAHLGMVFHRYLSRPRKPTRILINGRKVEAWDPFLEDHDATQCTVDERIALPGFSESVVVKGYVLPHLDMLGREAHTAAAGPSGWNAHQGFYLYRNERLIVAGGWLGLGGGRGWTQEEHYKLARIRVDIPNSMDHLWQLDVKKSSATPPPILKRRLKGLADTVRRLARSVFAYRGRRGPVNAGPRFERPWQITGNAAGRRYRINRQHPLVTCVGDALRGEARRQFNACLRIIEETVPVEQIWLDVAENEEAANRAFLGAEAREIRHLVDICCAAIQNNRRLSRPEALRMLQQHEEFSSSEAQAIITTMLEGAA